MLKTKTDLLKISFFYIYLTYKFIVDIVMDNKPNERKRTSGAIRDKDRTKNKMIQAVGKVLLKKDTQV